MDFAGPQEPVEDADGPTVARALPGRGSCTRAASRTTPNTSTPRSADLVHEDIIGFEAEDPERKIAIEVGDAAVDYLVHGERAHLRQHDQHARGGTTSGFRAALTSLGESLRA